MLRRFFVEKISVSNNTYTITGPEAKHISRVLRMKPGDQFILMDGTGTRFQSVIDSVSSREVIVTLEKSLPQPPPSPVVITLCQALPKSRAMDYLIQKTSELGVDCIAPFFSERAVPEYKKERLDNKMRHWHEIAINSAKQCGRGLPAKIENPVSFMKLMEKWREEDVLKAVLWEEEGSNDFKSLLKSSGSETKITCIVGPEGGFTGKEIETAGDAGFISVSVGRRILRAETAAIAAVAIIQYELGDLCL